MIRGEAAKDLATYQKIQLRRRRRTGAFIPRVDASEAFSAAALAENSTRFLLATGGSPEETNVAAGVTKATDQDGEVFKGPAVSCTIGAIIMTYAILGLLLMIIV